VAPDTPLRDLLGLFAETDAPVWVGDSGTPTGQISPRAVFAVLRPRA